MRRWLPILAVLLSASSTSVRGEVKVRGNLEPPSAKVGGSAVLTIVIEGAGSVEHDPTFRTPEGLRIRDAGQSRNFSMVNGRISQSLQLTYVVTALRAGTYDVGPVELGVSGRLYRVGPYRCHVGPQGSGDPSDQPGGGGGAAGEAGEAGEAGPPAVLVEMSVEPEEVYVGEPVVLRTTFWRRGNVTVLDARFRPPEIEGFWKEDLGQERHGQRLHAGTLYDVTEIVMALFPTRTGDLTISPARVDVRYREPDRRRRDPLFPFSFSGREREAEPASKPRTVRVLPLPGTAPAGFRSAVGQYRITSKLDREDPVQGEPLTWTIEIRGEGNIAAVEGPPFPEIPGCRGIDGGSEVRRSQKEDRVGGAKSFSRVLIPEAAGGVELPALTWAYFDPKAKRYETLRLPARRISISPAASLEGAVAGRVGGAIRSIRTEGRLAPLSAEKPWTLWSFWAAQVVPLLALGAGFVWRRRRDERERDPAGARLRAAPGRLRAALRAVEQDRTDPWGQLARGLEAFLADRYGAEVRGMTREGLQAHLVGAGAEREAAASLSNVLAKADTLRFTPAVETGSGELRDAVRTAAEAAGRLGRRRSA